MTATITTPVCVPIRDAQRRERRSRIALEEPSGKSGTGVLGQYVRADGRAREIVERAGSGGSVLVIGRDAVTLGDRCLIAHLGGDEPPENAGIVCREYLRDVGGQWCRAVTPEDLVTVPYVDDEECDASARVLAEVSPEGDEVWVADEHGHRYRLELVATRMQIGEVRWLQYPAEGRLGPARVVSVRDVIGAIESYEPVRSMTQAVLSRYKTDSSVSVCLLRGDLERVHASRIVLNRGLREAVHCTAEEQGISMSEIAVRCGRVKYDRRGNMSGEASWLARRLGLARESGKDGPTPWIHSDVLALIARRGLGISPREAELG